MPVTTKPFAFNLSATLKSFSEQCLSNMTTITQW